MSSFHERLCRNDGDGVSVILSESEGSHILLKVNSVKDLIESVGYGAEILRLMPQNDIVTQSPSREGNRLCSISERLRL